MREKDEMRTFDFDAPVEFAAAVSAIWAALDDEGLVLNTNTSMWYGPIRSVREGGIERFFVPKWRITPAESEAAR